MSTATAKLAPVDPNAVNMADADVKRKERFLRKALAEGGWSPARERLMRAELRMIEVARKAGER